MLDFEKELFEKGIRYIAGVDEVGRGPLAGPFVVGAVILDLDKLFNTNYDAEWQKTYGKINDSKKLTEKARNELESFIKTNCLAYSIVEISNKDLDILGISKITQMAFFNSVKKLDISPEHILTDAFGIKRISKEKQTNIKRGDSRSISIAAASIIAKVHRDRLMIEYSKKYPKYGFERHKGYGTQFHRDQLKKLGPCEIHRMSFSLKIIPEQHTVTTLPLAH